MGGSFRTSSSFDFSLAGLDALALAVDMKGIIKSPACSGLEDGYAKPTTTLPPIGQLQPAIMDRRPIPPKSLVGITISQAGPWALCRVLELDTALGKMSLDFIAPGGRNAEYMASSMPCNISTGFSHVSRRNSDAFSVLSVNTDDSLDRQTPDSTESVLGQVAVAERRPALDGFQLTGQQSSALTIDHFPWLLPVPIKSLPGNQSKGHTHNHDHRHHPYELGCKTHRQDEPHHPYNEANHLPTKKASASATKLRQIRPGKQTHIQADHIKPIKPNPDRTKQQREDRYPYDDDERYALIYLRSLTGLKWDDVVYSFAQIFPPGTPRRCSNDSAKGCPKLYARRCMQGLQCRYYRIRDEEALEPLRKGSTAAAMARWVSPVPPSSSKTTTIMDSEAVVCQRMVGRGLVGQQTLVLVGAVVAERKARAFRL